MCAPIKRFGQEEYDRVLNTHRARESQLGQAECESLLVEHGADAEQAKNGAYVFLHHPGSRSPTRRGSREEYARLLDHFGAAHRPAAESVRYLERLGFSYGQAHTAVYRYRQARRGG